MIDIFYLMKTIIILLFLAVTLGNSSVCEICIRTTEVVQNSLTAVTPTFIAEDVVRSVCERQCKILH